MDIFNFAIYRCLKIAVCFMCVGASLNGASPSATKFVYVTENNQLRMGIVTNDRDEGRDFIDAVGVASWTKKQSVASRGIVPLVGYAVYNVLSHCHCTTLPGMTTGVLLGITTSVLLGMYMRSSFIPYCHKFKARKAEDVSFF